METSQPLAIESFSNSWLSNVKPSLDSLDEPLRAYLDASGEATSKELDYKKVTSKRFQLETQNFDFHIPKSQSSVTFVHADELFSNGLIKPLFLSASRADVSITSGSIPPVPVSSFSLGNIISALQIRRHILGKWRKSSDRIFQKCFGYLGPFCGKIGGSRKSGSRKRTRVDGIDRKVGSWSNSPQASPRRSRTYSLGNCCDMDTSIQEAVLHCKQSIEI